MKKVNIYSEIGDISEKNIANAVETDSVEKLNDEIKREKIKKFRRIAYIASAVAACFCVVLICASVINRGINGKSLPEVKVANPIYSVKSYKDMNYYLGFTFPICEKKTAEEYILYISDRKAEFGEVVYHDGSKLRVKLGNENVSGVFGAKNNGSKEINGTDVAFFAYGGTEFAMWQSGEFSCCYYFANGERDADTIIENIIVNTKGN